MIEFESADFCLFPTVVFFSVPPIMGFSFTQIKNETDQETYRTLKVRSSDKDLSCVFELSQCSKSSRGEMFPSVNPR